MSAAMSGEDRRVDERESAMRIVLVGESAFGEKVFEGLVASGEEVVAVYTPPDDSPGKTKSKRLEMRPPLDIDACSPPSTKVIFRLSRDAASSMPRMISSALLIAQVLAEIPTTS